MQPSSIRASTEQLLDAAPDGMVIIDAEGVIRLVNRQAEAMFGYRREELVGQPIELLVPDRVKPQHPDHRSGYFHRPLTRPMGAGLELAARRKDGTEFPVDISLSSLQTDEGLLVSAAVRDMTDRKRSERKFQGLLEAAPDAILAVDADGIIHLVNRQAEALLGYTREELMGRPIDLVVPERVAPVHPQHRASYFAQPAARPMGAGLELSARRKDGTEVPVDISLSSMETEEGVWVTAAVRDITDRKRIDDERAQLQDQLQRAQQEEERAQLEAKLHQAQRLESVGQLAGGIAHDFNNLLAGIMSYAGLVKRTLEKKVQPAEPIPPAVLDSIRQDVGEITQISKRAADLVHQLLVFSRREVVKPEVLDLNEVVTEMEKLLRRTIGEHIVLTTSLHPQLPRTKGDRGQLEQVLLNLVVNARDAMPQGGRLEVTTEPFSTDKEYAREHGLKHGPYVRLTVSDTGTGMAPEVAQRAFEPFFTTKPKGAGSGLGLATLYGIVTGAGGDVTLYTSPGMGTTIRVVLPATDEIAVVTAVADESFPGVTARGTILLVEDEGIVRIPAERILADTGYDVLSAASAKEALELMAENVGTEIDLLLTDVVMPGISGKDLAEEVSRLSPGTKVLFMSGYSQGVITHQGVLEAGVDLIEKPFTGEHLVRRVRDVLSG